MNMALSSTKDRMTKLSRHRRSQEAMEAEQIFNHALNKVLSVSCHFLLSFICLSCHFISTKSFIFILITGSSNHECWLALLGGIDFSIREEAWQAAQSIQG